MNHAPPRQASDPSGKEPARLRSSGDYRELRSFNTTTVIYDATVQFCSRFLDSRSRLIDQMVQAARSGRQNIAEGSRASAMSPQTELRLINVARASLDELLLDYEDFLRQRNRRQWPKEHPKALAIRAVGRDGASDHSAYAIWLDSADPAEVANALICLIHQANFLLDRQITALERAFVGEGGYSEQLAAARLTARREQKDWTDPSDPPDPAPPTGRIPGAPSCPKCGEPMALRTARKGFRQGSRFWGCSAYPKCNGTRQVLEG